MHNNRRIIFTLALTLITVLLSALCVFAAPVRETDVTTPASGNTIVNVPGEFEKADVNAILALINSYRKEACEKGYPNPDAPSTKLTSADYSPVQWSGDLEWISQTRAAEAAVYQSHSRPGMGYFCSHNGVDSFGETLAWNNSGIISGIKQWYDEKEDWVNRNTAAETGHYTIMISLGLKYVGIGAFTSTSGDWTCVAGEYSWDDGLSTAPQGVSGQYEQKMEVQTSSLGAPFINGSSCVTIGKSSKYSVEQYVTYPHIWGGDLNTPVSVTATGWTSSNAAVASIDKSGTLKANKTGTATITAALSTGGKVAKKVTVAHPAKNDIITVKGSKYKVTKAGTEVAFKGKAGAKGKLTIPATVSYGGKKYKVTSISAAALKGNRKIKTVVIGKNVKSIGSKAFYKCTSLKQVTFKTKALKAKKVGSKAFTGSKVKTVKCPKGKKTAYRKILLKKGIRKSAKFK